MKIKATILIALFFAIFANLCFGQDSTDAKPKKIKNKKVAVTFDYLPAEKDYSKSETAFINNAILQTLAEFKISAAGFVVGDNIDGEWKTIIDWLEGGHTIGFMTHSGQDIENVPLDVFIADIKKGSDILEDFLQTYKQKYRYFRYPFLHYGSDAISRKKVRDILESQKIKTSYVSIVTEDFVYNLSFEKMFNSLDSTSIIEFGQEYLDHIIEMLARAESNAVAVAGRPVRHILQLRANRLNAYFLNEILIALEDRGYNFVELAHALGDKIYRSEENYTGLKSLSFLERVRISRQ